MSFNQKKTIFIESLKRNKLSDEIIELMDDLGEADFIEDFLNQINDDKKVDAILGKMKRRKKLGLSERKVKSNQKSAKLYESLENRRQEIIFERKKLIAENSVIDFGQFLLSVIGSIPPLEAIGAAELADATNSVIYLARGEYAFALLSLISLVPVVGDAVGKSGMIIGWLTKLAQGKGKLSGLASNILKKGPQIQNFLVTVRDFVKKHESEIKELIKAIHDEVKTDKEIKALLEDYSFSEGIELIADYVSSNSKLKTFFENEQIVNNLIKAVDELSRMLDKALDAVKDITDMALENPQLVSSGDNSTENFKLDEHKLKLKDLLKECSHLDECDCDSDKGIMNRPEEKQGYMYKYTLKKIADKAEQIANLAQEGDDVEEWIEAKITSAGDLVDTVYDYVMYSLGGKEEQSQNHFNSSEDF